MSIRSYSAIPAGQQLKLRELQILSAVVEAGSMAKAAVELSVAQPSISEAIANLEARLGVRLLDRSTRGIAPTVYALALLKRGRVVFDELGQAIRDLEFLGDPARGEVRIGCSESFSAGVVPAIIEQALAHHPQLTFHVVEANTAALEFRELRERNIDLMIGNISAPPLDDELTTEILFEDSYFVVAGAQSPWADHHEISLAELANEAWILGQPTNAVRAMVAETFRAAKLEPPRVSIMTTSMHVRLHLLATGHYLTVFHGSLLRYNATRWSLKVLPVDLGKRLPVAIVTLKNRTLSPGAQEFIKHSRAFASMYGSTRA
jgi:DNA-binding transcriptional LysR family regulator